MSGDVAVRCFVLSILGVLAVWMVVESVLAIGSLVYYVKCRKWCRSRGLSLMRHDFGRGGYGYVGVDYDGLRMYRIPTDYGDAKESVGMRVGSYDWRGTDKVAVDEFGKEVRLEYIGSKRRGIW